jgi:hypothetical protein
MTAGVSNDRLINLAVTSMTLGRNPNVLSSLLGIGTSRVAVADSSLRLYGSVVAAHELGPWQPLSLTEIADLFELAPFRWWITGGRALELHLGRTWRGHEDADVGMVRREVPLLGSVLSSWDVHLAAAGHLSRWTGRPLQAGSAENNLWCRRSADGPWELDVTVGEGDSGAWIYRRDPAIRIPWDEAVLHSDGGLCYLAPELQLLFKSKDVRPKDDVDAREVIPSLEPHRQQRLARLLPEPHPWRALLGIGPR